jgi:hypothetical protein
MVASQGPITECPVPRQDHAVLFQRQSNDLVVIQRPVVQNIDPQEPHPLREPAKHYIGDEFHKDLAACHEGTKSLRIALKNKSLNDVLDVVCM